MGLDDMVRLIIDQNDIFTSLALDEVCLDLVGMGEAPETLRFSSATKPAISLGVNQSADEVDINACQRAGWQVCRRNSGGTLAFLDLGSKISVSHIYRKEAPDRDQVGHTRDFCTRLMRGLKSIGVDYIELWNKCDIMARVGEQWRKIGSAAAMFGKNAALIHATINYYYPKYLVGSLLKVVRPFGERIPEELMLDAAGIAHGFVTDISAIAQVDREEVYSALKWQFGTNIPQATWTENELALARDRANALKKNLALDRPTKNKGLCDFGLGPYIPSFVICGERVIPLPQDLMLNLSERHSLTVDGLQLIQSRTKEEQVAIYQGWLASLPT